MEVRGFAPWNQFCEMEAIFILSDEGIIGQCENVSRGRMNDDECQMKYRETLLLKVEDRSFLLEVLGTC